MEGTTGTYARDFGIATTCEALDFPGLTPRNLIQKISGVVILGARSRPMQRYAHPTCPPDRSGSPLGRPLEDIFLQVGFIQGFPGPIRLAGQALQETHDADLDRRGIVP